MDDYSKLKKSIIKKVVKELKQKYVVSDRNGRVIDENEILGSFNNKCIGVTSSNTRCTRNAYGDSEYCKTHSNKPVKFSSECEFVEVEYIYSTAEKIDTRKLSKKFIQDTFYYIDIVNCFIYTKDGTKVGIIGDDEEFILTNNPYILNPN